MAEDTANLGISVTTTGVDEAKQSMDGLAKSASDMSKSVESASDEMRNYQSIARRTGESAEEVKKRFEGLAEARKKQQSDEDVKATEAAAAAFENLKAKLDPVAKAQQEYAKFQADLNKVIAVNPSLQGKVNELLSLAAKHYEGVIEKAARLSPELNALQRSMFVLSGQFESGIEHLGRLGQFLSAFGATGVAVGASVGALVVAFELLSHHAERLGETALQLKAFATTTGLTVEEIQALEAAAQELGVSGEVTRTFFQRMTVNMGELSRATGVFYNELLSVNPVLAKQAVQAKSAQEVLDILVKALSQAGTEAGRLANAIGGRGAVQLLPLLKEISEAGDLQHFVDHMSKAIVLTKEETKALGDVTGHLKEVRDQNEKLFEKFFAQDMLEALLAFNNALNIILRTMSALGITFGTIIAQIPMLGQAVTLIRALRGLGSINLNLPQESEIAAGGIAGVAAAAQPGGAAAGPTLGAGVAAAAGTTAGIEAQLNQLKAYVTALGDAAGAGDKLAVKLAELEVAHRKGAFATQEGVDATEAYTRAQTAAKAASTTAELQNLSAALGPAITQNELYAQKLQAAIAAANKLQVVSEDGKTVLEAETEALRKLTKERAADAISREQNLAQMQAELAALGNAATLTDQYRVKVESLRQQEEKGAISREIYNRSIQQAGRDMYLTQLRETVSALGDAATETQKYALQIEELREKLQQGRISQDTFNIAVRALNPIFKTLKDSTTEFATSFVQNMTQGKSMVESLQSSLSSLSKTLIDLGTKTVVGNLFSGLAGNTGALTGMLGIGGAATTSTAVGVGGAAAGAGAAGGGLLGLGAGALGPIALAAGLGISFLSSAFGSKAKKEADEAAAAAAAAEKAAEAYKEMVNRLTAAEKAFAAIEESLDPMTEVEKKIKSVNDAATELSAAMAALGQDTSVVATRVTAAMAKIKASFEKDILAKINEATGKGYINEIGTLFEEVDKMRKDAAALGVDPGMISKYFDVSISKIVSGADLTADAINELYKLFPSLTGTINLAAIATSKFSKSITEYLNSLAIGNLSPLSPLQQLDIAKKAYADTLTAAAAGDTEALGKITNVANDLLNTAKSFYASSVGYADIYSYVTSSLKTLADSGVGGTTAATYTPSAQTTGATGYAQGGLVSAGVYGADSVKAMLAGGEYVTRSQSVNASTLPTLAAINKSGAVNDNQRQNFIDLARTITEGLSRVERRLVDVEQAYRDGTQATQDTARQLANRTTRPGEKAA